MVAFVTDVLLCVILLGVGYIVLDKYQNNKQEAGAGGSSSSSSNKNKKKKQKAKSKKSTVKDGVADSGNPKDGVSSAEPSSSTPAGETAKVSSQAPKTDLKAPAKPVSQTVAAKKTSTSSSRGQDQQNSGKTRASNEEFPPLSASTSRASPQPSSSAPRPLAERLAKPTRKTVVDDMLDHDIVPEKTFSRTMRIVKPAPEVPTLLDDEGRNPEAEPLQYDDFGNVVEKEEEWERVPVSGGKRSGSHTPNSTSSASFQPSTVRTVPGMTEPTKKQRQNAQRAAAQKAAKDAAEAERLRRLAAHKRTLEKERMEAQHKERQKELARNQQQRSKRETLSGGMTAKVVDGSLIWE